MANKMLFQSIAGKLLPKPDARNEAGGTAYALEDRHALAQYASTGCLNGTFYASDQTQLENVLNLCEKVEPTFIAKTAIYAREKGFMKDLPALLCAVLSVHAPELLEKVFPRVIDNAKMLRNFVQIIRSGVVGRKSLGSLPKRLVRTWIENRTVEQLFRDSVGNDPSLADIVKMIHPKPDTPAREALYGYLIGREHKAEALPEIVRDFEKFKRTVLSGNRPKFFPEVPFQMLTSFELKPKDWEQIALYASWHTTRMNLNTFARHDVFKRPEMVSVIADRLRDREQIARARVFPYQLMTAYLNTDENSGVPREIRDALQDAMEIAIENVPNIKGKVFVLVDISGSMHSSVTGFRKGASSKVRCIDVAALIAASVLRKNPSAEIIPFESKVVPIELNSRDSVMTNAKKLASLPCGGTDCSAPMKYLAGTPEHLAGTPANTSGTPAKVGDLVIYVSDNESWMDSPHYGRFGGAPATETMRQWNLFKKRSPQAKMVCIDIQPYATTQAKESSEIFNVGGFSDQVFTLLAEIANGTEEKHWINTIENTVL